MLICFVSVCLCVLLYGSDIETDRQVLLQHDKIRECAVVGKPDETWGEKAPRYGEENSETSPTTWYR